MPTEGPCKASLVLPQATARDVANALSELYWPPAEAVGLFDNQNGTWSVEATFRGKPDASALNAFLAQLGVSGVAVRFEEIPDVDWVAISQAGLRPVRAGRFFIHGSHDRDRAHGRRWAIEIDAAQAFGTAHHGSTYGCLVAIDDLAKRVRMARVLDIGTGTGVLAIAAARAWPAKVIACDHDPIATATATQNIRRNGTSANISATTANGLRHPLIRQCAPYDLVIVNILAKSLMGLAHDIARALKPGGLVVLSGITREQAGRVAAAYCAAGFTRLRRFTISDWVTLTLGRSMRRR